MKNISNIYECLASKITQYITSIAGGLLLAFEASIPFFIPCIIATVLDIYSAYCLSRRINKKNPSLSDGKFKSEYKYRVMRTMLIAFAVIILANYVDAQVLKNSDTAVRSAVGFFLWYQCWSVLENWSSENNNPLAKILQKIMINKAERHFNIDLTELKDKENGKG